jgi:hypothetical protein
MEGQHNGVTVLIFDSIWGAKGGAPVTCIASQTERNPFSTIASREEVLQSCGWTVLLGVWFLHFFSWTMSVKHLDDHVKKLRVG